MGHAKREVVRSTLLLLSGRIWKLGCLTQIYALGQKLPIFNIINWSNHMHRGVGSSLFDPVSSDLPLLKLGEFIYCSDGDSFGAYLFTTFMFGDVSRNFKAISKLNIRASAIPWNSQELDLSFKKSASHPRSRITRGSQVKNKKRRSKFKAQVQHFFVQDECKGRKSRWSP